jgi:hypothetical protein
MLFQQQRRPFLSRNHAVGLGGTANLAVAGGNLPPAFIPAGKAPFGALKKTSAGGLVAHQNGLEARSTQTSTASVRRAPSCIVTYGHVSMSSPEFQNWAAGT